ncbi:Sensory/regulatory protein RpfC [Salinivirga cyanobacteriivorans]|uniref:histidine kinase n=1 Tax=Salinivirga cyanobacteriivorans TaxID=1307839 RepID=A0A0S2HYI6_9BACT|nr:PAS domain S-box protein [Salinivirga cyanobacteriivorans]ALO15193.1 Sensory/regulatory protein RpfC [Salinivirga cyanobacteriivorans]
MGVNKLTDRNYEYLFTKLDKGIIYQDRTKRIIDLNPKAQQILGIKKEELPVTFPDPDRHVLINKTGDYPLPYTTVLDTGEATENQFFLYRDIKHDREIPICIQAIPAKKAEESEPEIITLIIDYTDPSQVSSNSYKIEQWESIQDLAKIGVWEYNPFTNEFSGSEQAIKIYGIKTEPDSEQTTYKFPLERVQQNIPDREKVNTALKQLIEKSQANDLEQEAIEYEIYREDNNKKIHVQSIAMPVKDKKGNLIKIRGTIQDITRTKEMEQAIRENELKFRTIFEAAPIGILHYNPEGVITACNEKFVDIIGSSQEVLCGLNMYKLPNKKLVKTIDESLKKGSAKYEDWYTSITGKKTTYVRILFKGITDYNDQIIAGMGLVEDITDRWKAEQKLKENTQKLKTAQKIGRIGSWQFDLVSNKVEASKQAYEIYGLKPGQKLTIERTQEIPLPQYRTKLNKALEELLAGKSNYELEFKIKRPIDGKIAHIYSIAEFNKEKNLVIGTIQDITELKKTQETLNKREKEYRLLVENQNDLIVKVNAAGEFEFVSDSYCKLFDKSREQLLGSSFMPLVHEDDHASTNQAMKNLYKPPYKCVLEHRAMTKYGWRWLEWKDNAITDKDGNVTSIVGTGRDITERKLAETKVAEKNRELSETLHQIQEINIELEVAKEKAEQSDRLKTVFLGNLSHEIRTPMNGILGFANLLKSENLTASKQKKYLNVIQKSGRRMLALIDDLIDISRIEAGQMEIKDHKINLNELMDDIYVFFKPDAERKKLYFTHKKDLDNTEAIIKTDGEKLEQVITNLLKNALKFTREGQINFGYERVKNVIKFWVKDTGPGIPSSHLKTIFDRFRQVEDTPFREEEGSGLGLAISKAFVEAMGGEIWVDSQVNEGATFYFTLPYIPTEQTQRTAQNEDNIDIDQKVRILIAEDDDTSKMYLQELLETDKAELIFAKNGTEVIDKFQHETIDMILMDIKMPVMNGLDATRHIREMDPHIPIIAQTAYASGSSRQEALRAGCTDFISKPIESNKLKRMIRQYIKKR